MTSSVHLKEMAGRRDSSLDKVEKTGVNKCVSSEACAENKEKMADTTNPW